MQNVKNLSLYTPEKRPYGDDVYYLRSEDGQDWYEAQKKFSPDTVKILYDDAGVILGIDHSVHAFCAPGFSVAEVAALPDGCDISGQWRFVDGVVSPVPVDYHKKAESQRQSLLDDANNTTADWRTELSLGIISDEDKASLVKWMTYIKALKALDVSGVKDEDSFKAIKWPEVPVV
ncbi:tail fiber assembly protein [Escherichia coli]|uniref:tail fiber assembly protein n=1 Tax=Escherichia coli TaxID=562 RepID=UPI001918F8DC|nr:tail fiber assembly protein [Escherichia coli]CAD6084818.1 tail fiber assembly protein [Escherichia coli]CAD6089832.1 tail fiber assembly protein [Escherichia coli]CAD6118753.1 tail fiber assembly protein [Escherichia coli]